METNHFLIAGTPTKGTTSPPGCEHTHFPAVRSGGRELCAIHFYRCRAKRGLTQPDTHDSFWRIEFTETANAPSLARGPRLDPITKPIQGPLALGFGCHFGLGMFRRADT